MYCSAWTAAAGGARAIPAVPIPPIMAAAALPQRRASALFNMPTPLSHQCDESTLGGRGSPGYQGFPYDLPAGGASRVATTSATARSSDPAAVLLAATSAVGCLLTSI